MGTDSKVNKTAGGLEQSDRSHDKTSHICLLDNQELYSTTITALQNNGPAGLQVKPATGAGFARGTSLITGNRTFHVLCLSDHTSQPFTYLTLGAFATLHNISGVVALTGAHSLREDLFPGDIAIVRRASALPYPALYENRDPYGPEPQAEHYDANPEVIEKFTRRITAAAGQCLWQRMIPEVTSAYAKHPTWNGELMPWAPEQFEKLKSQGAETLSSAAAGVYQAQLLMPEAAIICINQIRSTPNSDSSKQWKRYRNRFNAQVLALLNSILLPE